MFAKQRAELLKTKKKGGGAGVGKSYHLVFYRDQLHLAAQTKVNSFC